MYKKLASILLFVTIIPCANASKINGLGQEYEVYDFGSYSDNIPWAQDFSHPTDPPNNNWYVPAHNYKNPVYLYQLNPSLVQSQMRNMRSSGVDVLVLHMAMAELADCEASGACPTPYNDGIWGEITDVSQQALRPQQQQNLTAILSYAAQIGFRKVFLRFDYNASGWTAWNEVEYSKAWNLIYNTHNLATSALANTATRLMVDLGGEQIGVVGGQTQAYVQRLWSDYTYVFGIADTVGFSFIGCGSFVQTGLSWYGALKPNQYAFDVYGGCTPGSSVQTDLTATWQALGTEKSKPIMLMETYTNDTTTASSIAATLAANPTMNLTDIVQWPLTRTPSCSGCDANIQNAPIAALATTTQVSNYLSVAYNAATDNLMPQLLNVSGVNCTATSPSTCAQFNIGYAPVGQNTVWQIWVRRDNGTRTAWGCNAGTAVATADWMVKGSSYRFDYYKTSSCTVNPTGGTPDATSFISFR